MCPAVVVRNGYKSYGRGSSVLQNFNMTVPYGSIYGLLGCSGGGKTTALSCIIGTQKLSAGSIQVFGMKPGINNNDIGYMPQETALFSNFTIQETFLYFGTLYGVAESDIKTKAAYLMQLLNLSGLKQCINSLSGGTKKRVSLAVALIHGPKLLILDEPSLENYNNVETVSVDPLNGQGIWKYLKQLSNETATTILITTHYIQEAKNCTMVGFMRSGHLLVEKPSVQLLLEYNTTSLDRVFKILCQQDSTVENQFHGSGSMDDVDMEITPLYIGDDIDKSTASKKKLCDSTTRLKALSYKNLTVILRNFLLLLFTVLVPAANSYLLCITFEDGPRHIRFGVVNYEMPNFTLCMNVNPRIPDECDIENLSCKYIKFLSSDILDVVDFASEANAIESVQAGSSSGYMVFPENYSTVFYERITSGALLSESDFYKSDIVVRMDETNKHIAVRIKNSLTDGFEEYVKSILEDCGYDKRLAEFSLKYKEPIAGNRNIKITDFIAPGSTVTWLFFYPIIATSIRLINEKKQGTYERTIIAGTRGWEIIFSFAITECFVLVLQSSLVFFTLVFIAGLQNLGSPLLILLLYVLSGFGGVSLGLLLGYLCNEEIQAALLAMALFFPNFFISGVIWPLEGMPRFWQFVAYLMPCTLMGEAMRSLFCRGWSFLHPNVWPGYVAIIMHTVLYALLLIVFCKVRNL